MTPRFGNTVQRSTPTSAGHDYGRSSPWYRNTGHLGRRHKSPAPLALLLLSSRHRLQHVVPLLLYERPRLLESDSNPTRKLSTPNTTPSLHVTQLIHNIWHNHNKLHLGEYCPPPWIRQSIKLPCIPDSSCPPWAPLLLLAFTWLHLQL
jgi:hypothetical protein